METPAPVMCLWSELSRRWLDAGETCSRADMPAPFSTKAVIPDRLAHAAGCGLYPDRARSR